MSASVFDVWRKNYKAFPDDEIAKIYDDCYKRDKSHISFSGRAVRVFLNQFKGEPRILEIGGRSGLLAKVALASTPEIKEWVNIDISKEAIESGTVEDSRYTGIWSKDFRWWKKPWIEGSDLLLLIHVVEHLSDDDVKEIISRIPSNIKGVHVQAPIPMRGPMDWTGFNGAHILSMGWVELNGEFEKNGFKSINAYDGASWKRK